MRVVVLKPYGRYSPGATIPDMPPGQAATLIARGLVREDAAYEAKPADRLDRQMKPRQKKRETDG